MKSLSLLIFPLTIFVTHATIIIDNYTAATNDRYTDDSSFILDSYDLSGVGQASNGRWATVIGANTIISANHFKPSGDITFSASNSNANSFVRTIDSANTQRISGTDLWVACLTEPVPTGTMIYGYDTTTPTSTYLSGTEAFLTGRSPESAGATFDQAYGTNLVTSFLTQQDPTGLGTADYIGFNYDSSNLFGTVGPPNPQYTAYEAALQSGDSGAPVFYDDGSGNLTLLGVNAYITTVNGDPSASYATHTGRYSDEIDTFVTDCSSFIPEPTSISLMILSIVGFCSRRTRS